ncbi:MAG: hypothetical protein WC250_01075 [Candidatus Paceibacterota bacterium]|jgi:hypothetical protein
MVDMSRKRLSKIVGLFLAGQRDRKAKLFEKDFALMVKRDNYRLAEAKRIVKSGQLKNGKEFYCAAMIFHHSGKLSDTKIALRLVNGSMERNYKPAKWLFAAVTDRILTQQGLKQKFGTQFQRNIKTGRWKLFPIDPKTTDSERIEFNVPTLKEIKAKLVSLNKKTL